MSRQFQIGCAVAVGATFAAPDALLRSHPDRPNLPPSSAAPTPPRPSCETGLPCPCLSGTGTRCTYQASPRRWTTRIWGGSPRTSSPRLSCTTWRLGYTTARSSRLPRATETAPAIGPASAKAATAIRHMGSPPMPWAALLVPGISPPAKKMISLYRRVLTSSRTCSIIKKLKCRTSTRPPMPPRKWPACRLSPLYRKRAWCGGATSGTGSGTGTGGSWPPSATVAVRLRTCRTLLRTAGTGHWTPQARGVRACVRR